MWAAWRPCLLQWARGAIFKLRLRGPPTTKTQSVIWDDLPPSGIVSVSSEWMYFILTPVVGGRWGMSWSSKLSTSSYNFVAVGVAKPYSASLLVRFSFCGSWWVTKTGRPIKFRQSKLTASFPLALLNSFMLHSSAWHIITCSRHRVIQKLHSWSMKYGNKY